ncbi:MAG: NifU N-terminal domain-containing protein [Euryarchaeota archaeon]|nr:NifU N-terminal domain-containing protein [Euryarchaeota archaeon]
MGVMVVVEATPNPNSMKFTLNARVSDKSLFLSSRQQAAGHPLAEKLFAIPGVSAVFLLNNFVSITRAPSTPWEGLVPRVKEVLEKHFPE